MGKERTKQGKVGVSSPAYTLNSSAQMLWDYGGVGVGPYIVNKKISRHLRVVFVEGSHLAAGHHTAIS